MNTKTTTTTTTPGNAKAIGCPDRTTLSEIYAKSRDRLVASLRRHCHSEADREDAVAAAYHKLMNKDRKAYGEKVPQTEGAWYANLYWQARAYLGHLAEHTECHTRFVEREKRVRSTAIPGCQGVEMDRALICRVLNRTLDLLCADKKVSDHRMDIYRLLLNGVSVQKIEALCQETASNIYKTKHDVQQVLQRHGRRYFARAFRLERLEGGLSAA